MTTCQINFGANDNDLAYHLYEGLIKQGVSCEQLDGGYHIINYHGTQCPKSENRTCVVGINDGIVTSNDVFEYALNNYEKYQELLQGVFGTILPWVLDDKNPTTNYDMKIRENINNHIDLLTNLIKKQGIQEGTEAYKEKMAIGLFYLVSIPDRNWIKQNKSEFLELTQELVTVGLEEYLSYLETNGGIRVEGDYSEEYSALSALDKESGECTEQSKILFAVLKMAGLNPAFAMPESPSKLIEEVKEANYLTTEEMNSLETSGMSHSYIGLKINKTWRLFDTAFSVSNANYKAFYVLSLRQYLGVDLPNYGDVFYKKGGYAAALAIYTKAIKIDSQATSALNNRGNVRMEKGNPDEAIVDFIETIKINPKHAAAHYGHGKAWSMKGNFDKAIAHYTESLKFDQKNVATLKSRGLAFSKKGNFNAAISDFKNAIEVEPQNAYTYINCGFALYLTGKHSEAMAKWVEAIAIEPKLTKDIVQAIYNCIHSYWQSTSDTLKQAQSFQEEMLENIINMEAAFIVSYTLWKAGKKEVATKHLTDKLSKLNAGLKESHQTSDHSKNFVKTMLTLMPKDMLDDMELSKLVAEIKTKLGINQRVWIPLQ